jgi:hypothetical protein
MNNRNQQTARTPAPAEATAPTYLNVFTVEEYRRDGKTQKRWTKIGATFPYRQNATVSLTPVFGWHRRVGCAAQLASRTPSVTTSPWQTAREYCRNNENIAWRAAFTVRCWPNQARLQVNHPENFRRSTEPDRCPLQYRTHYRWTWNSLRSASSRR